MKASAHIRRKLKNLASLPYKYFGKQFVQQRWQRRAKLQPKPHKLPGELIVTLTSFPARYPILHHTLHSLLTQSVRADKVMLWLYEEDVATLPASVRDLQSEGLTIRTCPRDTRSFKKLIPSLEQFPDAFLVTADDDIFYRPDWLEELLTGYDGTADILCLRAHYIRCQESGKPRPYRTWERKTEATGPSDHLFFTSGAGVLFPPHSLPATTCDEALFTALTPHADDIWLNWMAQASDSAVRRVGTNRQVIAWSEARLSSLWEINKTAESGNDKQIEAVIERFGFPARLDSSS
ncbi:hypothetical protein ACR0ST_02615 [Aliidiomarina sp. Khilg15.8]